MTQVLGTRETHGPELEGSLLLSCMGTNTAPEMLSEVGKHTWSQAALDLPSSQMAMSRSYLLDSIP